MITLAIYFYPCTSRSNEGQQCSEETAFVLSSHNLPSVSSSGISIEEDGGDEVDGYDEVDTTLGFIHQQYWHSPAPEAVFMATDDAHPSHSDEHDEEKRQPYNRRQQVGTTATGFDVSHNS